MINFRKSLKNASEAADLMTNITYTPYKISKLIFVCPFRRNLQPERLLWSLVLPSRLQQSRCRTDGDCRLEMRGVLQFIFTPCSGRGCVLYGAHCAHTSHHTLQLNTRGSGGDRRQGMGGHPIYLLKLAISR